MNDDKQKLTNLAKDTRTPCKYGAECYQKNPFHLSKYKHPPKKKDESETQRPTKKRKIEVVKKEEKHTNNVSESDDDVNEKIKGHDAEEIDALNIPGTSSNSANSETTVKARNIEEPLRNKCKISNDVSESEDEAELCKEEDMLNSPRCHTNQHNKDYKKVEALKENKLNNGNCSISKEIINNVPKANFDKKEFIKSKFLVEMPSDFYDFWIFCEKIQKTSPLLALKNVGLTLVGPYDVLAGKFDNVPEKDAQEYLIHWRYYYDVPEFQTVLKGDDASGYHIGYFRDSPNELPVFLAYNKAQVNGFFSEIGDNIFAAASLYLDDLTKTSDPFKKMQITKFASLIKAEAEKLKLSLSPKTQVMRERHRKTVAKTFNKIGLVVPYDRKTQVGYRELAMEDKELKQLLDKLAIAIPEQRSNLLVKLQPVLTFASIAADECDFGTSVELGWDILFCGVECLNSTVTSFLETAYRLLGREAFALIIEAHMKNRRKGSCLSIL